MLTRTATAAIAVSFLAPIAFGQMKYSRAKSQSPTPTPTPTPIARNATIQNQRIRPTKTMPAPTPGPISRTKTIQNPGTMPTRTTQAFTPTPTPNPRIQSQTTVPMKTVQPPVQSSTAPPNAAIAPARSNYGPTPSQVRQIPMPMAAPIPVKPTPTPVPPPDVTAYLERQLAKSQDKKFQMTLNGQDFPLTPFHVWPQKSTGPNTTSTSVSMRSDEGRIYDIEFTTTGAQVTGIRIQKINGEPVR